MQTATNPQTGEVAVLVGDKWEKAESVASNDKGEKAFLVGGKWLTPQAPVETANQKSEPTAMERGGAAIGGVNRGIAGLIGLPVDTAENIVNLGLAGFGTLATALGKPDLAPSLIRGTPGGSESLSNLMERLNIGTRNPRPDDAASRMLYTGGVIGGGSMIPGAGVKNTIASAAGGAIAGEAIGPDWVGVGAMAPSATAQAAAAAKNNIAAKVAPVVDTFKSAGSTPSVGQAMNNSFLSGLENLAAKFPGGAGVMKSFVENQQKQMGATVRTGVSAEDAGRAIEKGIKGDGGFLDRTKAAWIKLDDDLASKIPRDFEVTPTNTAAALSELTSVPKGASATGKILVNPRIQEIYDALKKDMAPPEVPKPGTDVPSIFKTIDKNVIEQPQSRIQKTIETAATELHPHGYGQSAPPVQFPQTNVDGKTTLPYQTVRELRSKVGSMLDDSLVSGIPNGELKKLYGALSRDLESAAVQAGAGREFARQNNYYRARMARVEDVLDRIIGTGKQPEDIFKTVNPTDPDQSNKVRAVMRSLGTEERKLVSEAVANRLGRATGGRQNELGDVFSSETFLTNWNKLSPGAKAQFFPDVPMRDNIERLAKASSLIRDGRGVYANPSGTAGSFAAYSVYASPVASIAAGSVAPVAAAAGAAGSAYIGAKMLTNPKVVEWLATPVNPSSPSAAVHLARLGVIYNNSKDQGLRDELARFIESAQK